MICLDRPADWRSRAAQIEPYAPGVAAAFRTCADELEADIREAEDEELTLTQAAKESGLAVRTLRGKVAAGEIPNAGQKHGPRIRRGDLPRRNPTKPDGRDPAAHVREITGGGR